jgi:hypothetical protein
MKLHPNKTNTEVIGQYMTVSPTDEAMKKFGDENGFYDIKDERNNIMYMLGEEVEVRKINEEAQTVDMRNGSNIMDTEDFTITYAQYKRDFLDGGYFG